MTTQELCVVSTSDTLIFFFSSCGAFCDQSTLLHSSSHYYHPRDFETNKKRRFYFLILPLYLRFLAMICIIAYVFKVHLSFVCNKGKNITKNGNNFFSSDYDPMDFRINFYHTRTCNFGFVCVSFLARKISYFPLTNYIETLRHTENYAWNSVSSNLLHTLFWGCLF